VYEKFGDEGHLYIVKPLQGGLDHTALEAYVPGTELLFSIYVPEKLRIMERQWIHELNKDPRFALVKGKEYFSGCWESAAGKLPTRGSAPAPRPPEFFS
jgi:hypothetical protein